MSIDFERLDAAITYAVEHPNEFDMGSFFRRRGCGTTACLAGTAAIQAGWKPVWSSDADDWPREETWAVTIDGESEKETFDVAADLLGFDDDIAEAFFFAPDLATVIAMRNERAVAAGIPARTWQVAE